MLHEVLLISEEVCHHVSEWDLTPFFRLGSGFACGCFTNKPHAPAVAVPLRSCKWVICICLRILLMLAGSPPFLATCSAAFAIAGELAGPKAHGAP